jgi:hypothetical protein
MKAINCLTSACKYCRYYQPEGRRGGVCQQLGTPVEANWKACRLALPPFAPSWERLEESWSLSSETKILTTSASFVSPKEKNSISHEKMPIKTTIQTNA